MLWASFKDPEDTGDLGRECNWLRLAIIASLDSISALARMSSSSISFISSNSSISLAIERFCFACFSKCSLFTISANSSSLATILFLASTNLEQASRQRVESSTIYSWHIEISVFEAAERFSAGMSLLLL